VNRHWQHTVVNATLVVCIGAETTGCRFPRYNTPISLIKGSLLDVESDVSLSRYETIFLNDLHWLYINRFVE